MLVSDFNKVIIFFQNVTRIFFVILCKGNFIINGS